MNAVENQMTAHFSHVGPGKTHFEAASFYR